MTVIDLSEQTDDIRCRYWEYWRSDKAPENCQPVTPRKITTASGKRPSGLTMSPGGSMGSPGNKPDPNPMKFFEGAQQHNQPSPKTKEEAGQLAVDARYHELENISDPKEREKAEKALRAHAEKTFGATDRYVDKVRDSQAKWEQRLTSLSEKNPLRTAAAPVVRAVQRQQRQKIGSMVLQSARKDAAIITKAQKNSEAFRQRQAQNQPGKDSDRER